MGDVSTLTAIQERVVALLGDRIVEQSIAFGELTVRVHRETILDAVRMLHDDPQTQFWSMVDVCGADYPQRDERFDVVYHLLSPTKNARIRLKVHTAMSRSATTKSASASSTSRSSSRRNSGSSTI
jgi:NADH-quinone oxidoreductase subunit C